MGGVDRGDGPRVRDCVLPAVSAVGWAREPLVVVRHTVDVDRGVGVDHGACLDGRERAGRRPNVALASDAH